ncbi:MAG: hypothetical protein V7767_05575 [Leeuwenhoekiella sp.]
MNSEKVDIKSVHINPSRIDSIYINKDSENGEVFIQTANKEFTFLTVDDIIKSYTPYSKCDPSMLIFINNKVIDNLDNIKIDDSYYIYVNEELLASVKYLDPDFKDLKIIRITFQTEKKEPEIRIKSDNPVIDYLKG